MSIEPTDEDLEWLDGEREITTEVEYLECPAVVCIDSFCNSQPSCTERKCFLAVCAACRRRWDLFVLKESKAAVVAAEQYVDGLISLADLIDASEVASDASRRGFERGDESPTAWAAGAAAEIVPDPRDCHGAGGYTSYALHNLLRAAAPEIGTALELAESRALADIYRDVMGNPFRPVTFAPEWRTATAVALAAAMYESRDFAAMPILADALQDAGCELTEILDHCRGPGPHVRGCWVVDHILGKS